MNIQSNESVILNFKIKMLVLFLYFYKNFSNWAIIIVNIESCSKSYIHQSHPQFQDHFELKNWQDLVSPMPRVIPNSDCCRVMSFSKLECKACDSKRPAHRSRNNTNLQMEIKIIIIHFLLSITCRQFYTIPRWIQLEPPAILSQFVTLTSPLLSLRISVDGLMMVWTVPCSHIE